MQTNVFILFWPFWKVSHMLLHCCSAGKAENKKKIGIFRTGSLLMHWFELKQLHSTHYYCTDLRKNKLKSGSLCNFRNGSFRPWLQIITKTAFQPQTPTPTAISSIWRDQPPPPTIPTQPGDDLIAWFWGWECLGLFRPHKRCILWP